MTAVEDLKVVTKRDHTLYIPSIFGQFKVLEDALKCSLEMSRVIQMGDLLGLTELVDANSGSRWHRGGNYESTRMLYDDKYHNAKFEFLIGPNEMLALNAPRKGIVKPETAATIRSLWFTGDEPRMKVATVSRNRLVTHAGLTYGLWRMIGEPETADQACVLLNRLYRHALYPGECLALGDAPSFSANPIFANLFIELLPSWITADVACPFDQMTANGSLHSELGRLYLGDKMHMVHYVDDVKLLPVGSAAYVKGCKFTSLDLGLPMENLTHIPEHRKLLIESLRLT